MHGMPFISFTYVWRIIDSLFISTAYQRRTYGVTRVSTANVLCTSCVYIRLLWIMCFALCCVSRVCLYIKDVLLKYLCVRFFHSRGSDVSKGPWCRAGLFQGYVHDSLCICFGRLTNTMGSYWRCFPLPLNRFILVFIWII